jgi:hypothetical protein
VRKVGEMTQLVWFGVFIGMFVLAVAACDKWESEVDWNE